jgi:hypothetical protein
MQNQHAKTETINVPEHLTAAKAERILEVYFELTPDVIIETLFEFSRMQRAYLLSKEGDGMMPVRKNQFESNINMIEQLLEAAM